MKYSIPILLIIGIISAFKPSTPQYEIQGIEFDHLNGQTIYLWKVGKDMISYDNGHPLDSAIVTNGTFRFTGPEDTLHMYYIDPGFLFLPERGVTVIDPVLPCRKSTPRNAELWKLWKEKGFPDKETSMFMKSNITNALGVYLFNRGAVTDPNDLESLYTHSNPFMRDYSPLVSLRKQLDSTNPIRTGGRYIDFEREDITARKVRLSDIAGKGKPVCVCFILNPNDTAHIKQHIGQIKNSQPETIFIALYQYTPDPAFRNFQQETSGNPIQYWIEDNNRFEESVHYRYRIRNAANYFVRISPYGEVEANYVLWEKSSSWTQRTGRAHI